MIVLDASVLIAHLDAGDAHHERAVGLLEAAADEELSASVVTLAEVLVGPQRAGRLDVAQTALRALAVEGVGLGADAAVRLTELRARTRLKLPDCCVLLAAEERGAEVATFDARLATAAGGIGLPVRS